MSAPSAETHRLVLEIEVPDFYVDGTTQEFADEHGLTIADIVTEEWMRDERVHLCRAQDAPEAATTTTRKALATKQGACRFCGEELPA